MSSELVLYVARGRGSKSIRGDGRDDNELYFRGANSCLLNGFPGGLDGHVRSKLVLGRDASFLYARPGGDPLV